jgi:hypothetical protein
LGPNWFFNGIPISSEAGYDWISARTGQKITATEFGIPVRNSSPFSTLQPYFAQGICDLPDKSLVQEILSQVFASSSFRLSFPILDQVLFEETVETAYKPMEINLLPASQISAKACVLSTLSLTPRFCATEKNQISMDADIFAAKAHHLLMRITGYTSLETLQALLMLVSTAILSFTPDLRTDLALQQSRCVFSAHWEGAAFFHSIACRTVCSLGGHIFQPLKPFATGFSHLERLNWHIRTLFWSCYILDKDLSIRTGNPPLLTDVYCDLTTPNNHLDYYTSSPGLAEFSQIDNDTDGQQTPLFPGDIHLSILKEKVFQLLFSARALKDNDNQLLLNIRQLDDEIEHWRLSIPVDFRPALFVSHYNSPDIADEGLPHVIRRICLQLDYHHLMTVIHTTVRRCTTEACDGTQELHDVVHSSFDLSLVASRSTLWCLKFLIGKIAEEAFRSVVLL